MKIGSKVKNFSAEMTGNKKFSLKEFTGKNKPLTLPETNWLAEA